MKPIEILADYFASQELSEIQSQIYTIIRLTLLNDSEEREKFVEFGAGLHDWGRIESLIFINFHNS